MHPTATTHHCHCFCCSGALDMSATQEKKNAWGISDISPYGATWQRRKGTAGGLWGGRSTGPPTNPGLLTSRSMTGGGPVNTAVTSACPLLAWFIHRAPVCNGRIFCRYRKTAVTRPLHGDFNKTSADESRRQAAISPLIIDFPSEKNQAGFCFWVADVCAGAPGASL